MSEKRNHMQDGELNNKDKRGGQENMKEEKQEEFAGEIKKMGILDLTGMKSAEQLQKTTRIEKVGTVLVPEDLMDSFMNISMEKVGTIVPVPRDQKYKIRTGQMELSPEMLASGDEDTRLILVGQGIMKKPVEKIGYCSLHLSGQFLFPRESQSVLEGSIDYTSGQLMYFKGSNPRIFTGDQKFSATFFEMIEEPMTMILVGTTTFAEDVTAELLQEKLEEIVMVGELVASEEVISVLQLLAEHCVGEMKTHTEVEKGEDD